jgi:hypothetical protein
VEHQLTPVDDARESGTIGEFTGNPVDSIQRIREILGAAEAAHPGAALQEMAAKISADKPARAKHEAWPAAYIRCRYHRQQEGSVPRAERAKR